MMRYLNQYYDLYEILVARDDISVYLVVSIYVYRFLTNSTDVTIIISYKTQYIYKSFL